MVQKRTCDYTGEEIEPGTGKMYVKTDGTVLWFKGAKAEKNYFLGRESRDLEWIGYEEDEETDADEEDESDSVADDTAEISEDEESDEETETEAEV
ncbi:50S ribosomal protein L24e [Halovenus rubra]|uniref:50S ribosomal protein L24e n=2 Tax=Halovenus rubra TaxID=869890 RepID=A0ACC7DXL1_9EURY